MPPSLNSQDILSITSANGWCAVFQHQEDKTLFKVPLVAWALVRDWDAEDWMKQERSNAIIGLVLTSGCHIPTPAAEVEFVGDEDHQDEDPALFCGYIEPGENPCPGHWKPIWEE
jgi:hypothetical protein